MNISYNINPYRKSTSNIPYISLQNANYIINLPQPIYTYTNLQSPPIYPIFSTVTENIQHELNVLTSEKHLVLDKNSFQKQFLW